MVEVNSPPSVERAALDYGSSAPNIVRRAVKLTTNPAWIRTRLRRVQISTRQFGSLKRCWAALPIAPVGTRSVRPARALGLATDWRSRDEMVPVRFG